MAMVWHLKRLKSEKHRSQEKCEAPGQLPPLTSEEPKTGPRERGPDSDERGPRLRKTIARDWACLEATEIIFRFLFPQPREKKSNEDLFESIGVLFRLVCLEIDGTGLDWCYSIYQDHLFYQKDTFLNSEYGQIRLFYVGGGRMSCLFSGFG